MKDKQISLRVSCKDIQYVKRLGYGLTEIWELGVESLRIIEPEVLKERIEHHKFCLEKYKKLGKNLGGVKE